MNNEYIEYLLELAEKYYTGELKMCTNEYSRCAYFVGENPPDSNMCIAGRLFHDKFGMDVKDLDATVSATTIIELFGTKEIKEFETEYPLLINKFQDFHDSTETHFKPERGLALATLGSALAFYDIDTPNWMEEAIEG